MQLLEREMKMKRYGGIVQGDLRRCMFSILSLQIPNRSIYVCISN